MPNISVNTSRGLTLIELLLALSIGMIVLGALTATFILQRKAYSTQEQVIEMTQIARAAMDMIGREARMAGYFNPANPMQRDSSADPQFRRHTRNAFPPGDPGGSDRRWGYRRCE